MARRCMNGIQAGFGLEAYNDYYNSFNSNTEDDCDYPCDNNDYTEDEVSVDVKDGCEARIYINGVFQFGPIKGACNITIK